MVEPSAPAIAYANSIDTTIDEDSNSSEYTRSHSTSLSSCSGVDDAKTPMVAGQKTPFAIISEAEPSLEQSTVSDWSEAKEKTVNQPFDYVCRLGGKGFRKQLLLALDVWLNIGDKPCAIIEKAVTMLHNASLMIDDIQDGSKFRRGSLSTHKVYGVASTINSANLVYFQAQDQLRQLDNWPDACSIFIEELINLHRGQGMELYWRDNLLPPSEPDYLQMISNKTGALFKLILRLMASQSSYKSDLVPLIESLGLMFQIIDDYLNLKDGNLQDQKGFCEDLTEGKFSYPVSYAIWNKSPQSDAILAVLKSRSEDNDVKAWVVSCLEQEGVFEQTRQQVETCHLRIQTMLSEIPEKNPALEKLVQLLISKIRI